MSLLLMYFMEISFLVINSTRSMFGTVWCTSLIQEYQTVKSFPTGNQSPGVAFSLGMVIISPATSLCSRTLPQGIFPLSITWRSMKNSALFSISIIMKTPQYSGTTLTLTCPHIKSRWRLGIVLYFIINVSLLLNGRRNAGSFKIRTIFMPFINPNNLPFVWRILFIL